MNSSLTAVEIMVVLSATLQILAILISIFLCKTKGWRTWIWLTGGMTMILFRRILAMFRFSQFKIPTLEIEYIVTVLVSICFIIFLVRVLKNESR